MIHQAALWLRWSWRDLRRRWVQVVVIAFVIALGSGTYSGLGSTAGWRTASYDASFDVLRVHDLRVTLTEGSFVNAAALVDAAGAIPRPGRIAAAEAQLTGSIQVDASARGSTVLVPGRLVGVDTRDRGPHVDRIRVVEGRPLRGPAAGEGVLDVHFARRHDVRPGDRLRISGDHTLDVTGLGLSPEYFTILGDQGVVLAESTYAVVFASLPTAQQVLGHPGQANALVVRARDRADADQVRRDLAAVLSERFPETGFTIVDREDERQYRLMYDDIEGDQRLYNVFAALILAGAAFAAFNLTGRIVESQRREIGIGMALGVPGPRLAIRPLLVAFQIALLGAIAGVVVGLVVAQLVLGVLRDFFPLPIWRQPLQTGSYLRGLLLGIVIPFAAAALPVWRALRVTPVEAIRSGAATTRGGRLMVALRRIPLPGRTTTQLPARNVTRQPRRTVMTALGIAAAIAVLLGVSGMVDSFYATIDRAQGELTRTAPRRLTVVMSSFQPSSAPAVEAVRNAPVARASHAELQLPASVRAGGERIDVLLAIGDLDSRLWHPTIEDRRAVPGPGIVLSRKAADDLGVEPGGTVRLRHPRREGLTSYRFVTTPVRVAGVNPIPTRSVAWMDRGGGEAITNLEGITNVVVVDPRPGIPAERVERALFEVPGVASVRPVAELTETIRTALDRVLGIILIVEGAVLLLALLIAFNTASINADDRRREHATMFAFGLPLRTVAMMGVAESVLIGILGTALGLAAGRLLLAWLVNVLLPTTLPDLGIVAHVSTATIGVAVVLGVVVVALAPLLTVRRLARMDVPSALRVVE